LLAQQRSLAGAGTFVRSSVGVAGQDALGLPPAGDGRTAGGGHLAIGGQIVQQLLGLLRGHVVHELPVDRHHRGEVTGRIAFDPLEAELAVGGGLVRPDAQLVADLIEQGVAAHHRTQRRGAHPDVVLSARTTPVHGVEGGHAGDLSRRDPQDLGADLDTGRGDPSVHALHQVQHRQQR